LLAGSNADGLAVEVGHLAAQLRERLLEASHLIGGVVPLDGSQAFGERLQGPVELRLLLPQRVDLCLLSGPGLPGLPVQPPLVAVVPRHRRGEHQGQPGNASSPGPPGLFLRLECEGIELLSVALLTH
jgi:hypothetical protein